MRMCAKDGYQKLACSASDRAYAASREKDDWRKGRVTKLNYTADGIHAVVEGSAPDDVDILLHKGEISDTDLHLPLCGGK